MNTPSINTELNDRLWEILFNMTSNAAEWGQDNPDMDVNVERMRSREISKDYIQQLIALMETYANEARWNGAVEAMEACLMEFKKERDKLKAQGEKNDERS